MRVLIATWDGGSNVQPFEVLAQGLVARGDDVDVLSHEPHRSRFEALGAAFHPLSFGQKPAGERGSDADDRRRVGLLMLSSEVAHTVVDALESCDPDVVLVDASLLGPLAACEAADRPTVIVHHSLPCTVLRSRLGLLDGVVAPMNELRGAFGLPRVGSYRELLAHAAALIAPTIRVLDEEPPWPMPLVYVGPLQPDHRLVPVAHLPERFVLVSFSTTWQRQAEPLQRVIDALVELDVPVVVTTGPSLGVSELTARSNTIVVGSVPHAQVLDRVDVVVTHAGHGTVVSALAAGVPMVCVPQGRDQHDVARRVSECGAGLTLASDVSPGELLEAVRQVGDNPGFGASARRLAESAAAEPGLPGALAIIDDAVEAPADPAPHA